MMKRILLLIISSCFIFINSFSSIAEVLGDFNNDGTVDQKESIYALQVAAGMSPIIGTPEDIKKYSLDSVDGEITDAVYVDANGNVGIGTTTPNFKITLYSDNSVAINLKNASSVYGTSGVGLALAVPTSGTDGELWNYENGYLRFGTNNQERVRIDNYGNIGIGITNPTERLEVVGTIKATSFIGDGSELTGISQANIYNRPDSVFYIDSENKRVFINTENIDDLRGGVLQISTSGLEDYHHLVFDNPLVSGDLGTRYASISKGDDGFLKIYSYTGSNVDYSQPITFHRHGSNGGEVMRIHSNGNVGIGTEEPSYKLDVSGTIRANSFVGNGSALTGISCSCECDDILKIMNLQQKIYSMDVGYTLKMPLSKTYWRRAYDGHIWDEGAWEETSDGLRIYGRGSREGNGINSKVSLNFQNTEMFIQWKVNGNGQYSAFGLGITGAPNLFSGTTHHSYGGSTLLSEDTWYFTRISINEDKSYTAVTTTENYDTSEGIEFVTKSGVLKNYWHRLSNTVFDIRIGDNYGSIDTYIEIKEIIYKYRSNN